MIMADKNPIDADVDTELEDPTLGEYAEYDEDNQPAAGGWPTEGPRTASSGWYEKMIYALARTAHETPAWAADFVESEKLRDAPWLNVADLKHEKWHAGDRDYDEPGPREQAILDRLNETFDGDFNIADAGDILDYTDATNILRLIDEDRGTNFRDRIADYRSVDYTVNRTGKNPIPLPDSGLPPADDPFVAREFRLDQLDLSADDREAEPEAAVSESSVDLDKEPAHEVPVDSGVRVDPIAAGAARPGAQSVLQPDQRVHDIASWLHNANLRARAGEAVKPPKPIKEVLGHFKSAPIDQTRIQILAAAAAARTLEGEQSANAQRLNKLVVETQTRLNAIRDHERRTAALEHREKETPREKIAEWDQNRVDRESANDRNVFNAAAAVAAGYVAARGLPAHDQLAQLADEQLGPVPEAPAPAPDKTPQPEKHSGPSKAGQIKNVLDSAGRGLAQAVGPVAGDDEVAPNLSPVNMTQVTEEFAQLAASIAPAMKAAMGSHPRSVKELLNIVQTPDEESDLAFEQDTGLGVEREREAEHSV